MMNTLDLIKQTKNAARSICNMTSDDKSRMLSLMADCLVEHTDDILSENKKDVEIASESIGSVMIDRLVLNKERILMMAEGIRKIAQLPDGIGECISENIRPNGLVIRKIRVPLGLVAIIYESRPNVTSDAACLALKSGNACVLRCGKEAYNSSCAIVNALKEGIRKFGSDENIIALVDEPGRESANVLMTATGLVDLLIPRGGAGLINACIKNATVPCIQTGTGICHIYVDESADMEKALDIIDNAKTSRPSVCNAAEVCLVHSAVAEKFLPALYRRLVTDKSASGKPAVELRLCERSCHIIPSIVAGENDFDTEFLDYTLAIKIVDSTADAVFHIRSHSTGHSEAIITNNESHANEFVSGVDSAAVYVNASTRFTDGGEFGLGCEMGISTQKLHARGPMGLMELTTYKYVIIGNGQTR